MSLTNVHPQYSVALPWWEQMRDTYAGERAVKQASIKYLPATSGQVQDGYPKADTRGTKDYLAYLLRAQFYDSVDDAVGMLLGVMHSKPATFELPSSMEYLIETASRREESLEQLLQRINENQMTPGRLGLLADIVNGGDRKGEFYLALYATELCINWDTGRRTKLEVESLNLVVLNESGAKREADGFTWGTQQQYRVLTLGDVKDDEPSLSGFRYQFGIFTETATFNAEAMTTPHVKRVAAEEIPFVFINAVDIDTTPGKPPLMGLSDLSLANYRKSADYNLSLFMQGQDTLVKVGAAAGPEGEDEPTRVGAGAQITIPMPNGKAYFIGVDSKGLPEQRQALESGLAQAQQFASKLVDSATRERESGSALRIRLATRTATLTRVAIAGAYGLQTLLRKVARWMGESEETIATIRVIPNLDFVDDSLPPADLVNFMTAKDMGAPMSLETMHELWQKRGMTALSFAEEVARIKAEKTLLEEIRPAPRVTTAAEPAGPSGGQVPGGGNPNAND